MWVNRGAGRCRGEGFGGGGGGGRGGVVVGGEGGWVGVEE